MDLESEVGRWMDGRESKLGVKSMRDGDLKNEPPRNAFERLAETSELDTTPKMQDSVMSQRHCRPCQP